MFLKGSSVMNLKKVRLAAPQVRITASKIRLCVTKVLLALLVSCTPLVHAAQWAIIGAGPAGIVIVGLLLDLGVPRDQIVWIDPEFNVGRLGQYYETVPGNTKTCLYIDFIRACKTFQECSPKAIEELQKYELALEYSLSIIIKPLQQITECMRKRVDTQQTMLTGLEFADDKWHIECGNGFECDADRVVLATGSYPRSLNYTDSPEIPLDMPQSRTSC